MSDPPVQAASYKRVADHADDYGFDDLDEGSASKRRRMRYRVACLPCQRKKCKCEWCLSLVLLRESQLIAMYPGDGGAPCASCQRKAVSYSHLSD